MDIERALISKTLREQAFVTLIECGIKEEYFPVPEHAAVFRWMKEYYQQYGEAPTAKGFKQNYPAYKLVSVDEPLIFLIDELRKAQMYGVIEDTIIGGSNLRKDGAPPTEIMMLFSSAVSTLSVEFTETRDIDITKTHAERLARYEELENLIDGMRGITTGFPGIDEVTAGLQAGQLITVIGAPKAGKSVLLLRMAIAAHEAKNSVLFIGFEMSNAEQEERYDMIKAGIAHERLRRGKLMPPEKARLTKWLSTDPEDVKPFLFSQDVSSATTLSGLQAKVKTYRPEIVFVDGTYMMDDENGEEKGTSRHLTNITRGMKRLAQQLEIPVVITTQVLTWKLDRNKKKTGGKITADAIGYSSSFAQDSDLILGLENGASDIDKELRIIMARNSGRVDISLNWDWSSGDFNEMGNVRRRPSSYDEEENEDDGVFDLGP